MRHLESYALNSLLLLGAVAGLGAASMPGNDPTEPVNVDTSFAAVFVPGIPAVTYDPMQVPETGKVKVTLHDDPAGQEVSLWVAGLEPNRVFGARLHVNECGPTGADAGAQYQHAVDPAATAEHPSADPAYANPDNEVWLDFITDANGVGAASSVHTWQFDPQRAPRSLVIHQDRTGDRLACVNLH
jgi:Cu-Zn family superoxide dismutase